MIKHKVVITTVPFIDEDSPLCAPAVLKANLVRNGIECVGLDLNISIFNKIKNHPFRNNFLKFFYEQTIDECVIDEIVEMIYFYANKILEHKPTIIGLSLFTIDSQCFTAWLCSVLRTMAPDVKIVIGGPGLQTLEEKNVVYPERLKQINLIDDYIVGDADFTFVEYVKNQNMSGANTLEWKPVEEFDTLPMPDYSDYNFFEYGNLSLPIVDSRGCVQNCEFCDVIAFWKKFQYQLAENIFEAMMHYIKTYNIYRFQLASSICNGNMREFKKLVKLIADYNKKQRHEVTKISWHGSFIIRPKKHHTEELFQLIKESNGYLYCGVESIVSHVRKALGKNFDNDDLEHHLKMCKKYQISVNLLMISSYYTETDNDYEIAKQWFRDHKEYANNTVEQVQFTLLTILSGTNLEKNIDAKQFENDTQRRLTHAQQLVKVAQECGFTTRTFF